MTKNEVLHDLDVIRRELQLEAEHAEDMGNANRCVRLQRRQEAVEIAMKAVAFGKAV